MNHRIRRRWGALTLLLLLLGVVMTGCGLAKRPAPSGEQEVPPTPAGTAPVSTLTAALFFADWQVQHLIPEARQLPEAEGAALATAVVQELLKGPTDPHLRRSIPAGTELLEPVTVQDGVAYVNLSRTVANLRGTAETQMLLGSLALSLTEVAGVDKVQLLIDGKKEATLGGIMLDPLERGLYAYPVLVDAERIAYLQSRYDQGFDTWRADPSHVLRWEGRMFGFRESDLEGAHLAQTGKVANATLTQGGVSYTIQLVQNETTTDQTGIWTITSIHEK